MTYNSWDECFTEKLALNKEDLNQIMKDGSVFILQALRKLYGFCQLALTYSGIGVTRLLNACYAN